MTLSIGKLYTDATNAMVRAERGWLDQDPFCVNCGDYYTQHTTPTSKGAQALCLFAPTTFVAMTYVDWQVKRVAAGIARVDAINGRKL